jgi:AraC-like DNA-binding protein
MVYRVCMANRPRTQGPGPAVTPHTGDSGAAGREGEALAKRVNMSPSALHAHFSAVAGVSPIQYQKQLRLQEARARLLSGGTSAEAVAYQVGYASPSQFSREYARLFGQPPRRDADRMRDLTPVLP